MARIAAEGGFAIRITRLALVVGAVLCWSSLAQSSSHDARIVEDVRWETKRDLSIRELAEAEPRVECDPVPVLFDESDGRFHFEEAATDGCAEVRLSVNLTGDVREAELRFRADRRIVAGGMPAGGIAFRQRIFAYNESLVRIEERVIFATTDPPEGFRDFAFRFAVPPGTAQVTLAWFFQDMNGTQGVHYGSAIEAPRLHLVDQQLPAPTESVVRQTIRNDTRLTTVEANVSLPAGWEADDRGSLRVTVDEAVTLLQVVTPTGQALNLSLVDQTLSRGKRTVHLSNVLLDELGHGFYKFQFQRAAPAQVDNPIGPSPTIFWLAYAALICPVLPLPGATRASWRYMRETPQGRSQRAIPLAATGVVAATYLVTLFLALNQDLIQEMGRLPLTSSAASVYSMMLLLCFIGVAIWLLAARVLLSHVRWELGENRRLVQELERSNQDLQQFAYAASHDLREPVRAISLYAQLLESDGKDLGPEEREHLNYIRESAARMRALIDGLLQYARVQRGDAPQGSVDLEQVLADSKKALAATIEETGARITHDPLPRVRGDAAQLASVLQNLLSNAMKFQRPSTKPVVHISAVVEDGSWRISVRDNGIGIDTQYADQLFVLFRRLHGRTTYPGTGIGLAMAKRIVERHGGTIGFASRPGEGSVFWFTLPAS